MKTSFDSFLSITSPGKDTIATTPASTSQEATDANILTILPEDVLLRIFAFLSESMLRKISLVSKNFAELAGKDVLWQFIAESILFSYEIKAKSEIISYKNFCRDRLSIIKLTHFTRNNRAIYHSLKSRDPAFVYKIKQMQLPNYKILTPTETQGLCQKEDTRKFLWAAWEYAPHAYFLFHHVAHQQVGDITFYFLNCTHYVISFNSDGLMLINKKLTDKSFSDADCQLLIYIHNEDIFFYKCDIGSHLISRSYIHVKDLELDDYTQIKWHFKYLVSKSFPLKLQE